MTDSVGTTADDRITKQDVIWTTAYLLIFPWRIFRVFEYFKKDVSDLLFEQDAEYLVVVLEKMKVAEEIAELTMQRADSSAKDINDGLCSSFNEPWWSFVGFDGRGDSLLMYYFNTLKGSNISGRTAGHQAALTNLCDAYRQVLIEQIRYYMFRLDVPIPDSWYKERDVQQVFAMIDDEHIVRAKHSFAVQSGLFHSITQNSRNQIKSFLASDRKKVEGSKGSLFWFVSQDWRLGDLGILIVICTLYRLPLVLRTPFLRYNIRNAFILQFKEIACDFYCLAECIVIFAGVKYVPRLIIDGARIIYHTANLGNFRILTSRLICAMSVDIELATKNSNHFKNVALMYFLPLVVVLGAMEFFRYAKQASRTIVFSCLVLVLFTSFYRIIDVFTCWQFELSCYLAISLPIIIGYWHRDPFRKPIPWDKVRPTWVNYIQFVSTGLQAAQLFSLYMLRHVEYHPEWSRSWTVSFSKTCLLTDHGYALVFFQFFYNSIVAEVVTSEIRRGYLLVFGTLIAEGLLFSIAHHFHENDAVFHVFSLMFMNFIAFSHQRFVFTSRTKLQYRWIQDVGPNSLYGTLVAVSNAILAILSGIDNPLFLHTAIFLNRSVVVLGGFSSRDYPCTSWVYYCFQLFCAWIVVAATSFVRYDHRVGMFVSFTFASLAISTLQVISYRQPEPSETRVTADQIREELVHLKEELVRKNLLWPSHYRTLWDQDVSRAVRVSELAYCLLMLEYDTKFEALGTSFIYIRKVWFKGMESLVERCDFIGYHSQSFRFVNLWAADFLHYSRVAKRQYRECGISVDFPDQNCDFDEPTDYQILLLHLYMFKNSIVEPEQEFVCLPQSLHPALGFAHEEDAEEEFQEVDYLPSYYDGRCVDIDPDNVYCSHEYIQLVEDSTAYDGIEMQSPRKTPNYERLEI